MKITDILSKNNIFLNIDVTSKKLLFKEISQQISKKAKVGQNEILEKLNEREKLGTTAIGNGVAIPHMKIENLKQIFSLFFKYGLVKDVPKYPISEYLPIYPSRLLSLLFPFPGTDQQSQALIRIVSFISIF